MNSDETNPPFPSDPVPPTNQTTTTTKIETVETDVPGKRNRHPGELFGMSGRFWVTIFSLVGSTIVVVLVIQSPDIEPQAKALTIGGYVAMAASIANTYIGQNAGPTKAKPS